MLCHRPSLLINQPLTIHEPNLSPRSFIIESLKSEITHQLLRDTDTSATCTQEENTVSSGVRATRSSRCETSGVEETGEDDGTCALDVIVEDGVRVAETVEISKGVVG